MAARADEAGREVEADGRPRLLAGTAEEEDRDESVRGMLPLRAPDRLRD